MTGTDASSETRRRWAAFLILFGLYLTVRGYRSFEGDQAYRFPIFRHAQDVRLFAVDPFVRAFDHFNPHRGYFALLDAAARPAGLAAGLMLVYGLTFALTCYGLDRLAWAVWPGEGGRVGLTAAGLVLVAQAGNIGTNHLFEPILLDRLIAFGLGWVGLSAAVGSPRRGGWVSAAAVGLAGLIHPSVGLQLAMLFGAGWVAWTVFGLNDGSSRARNAAVVFAIGLAALPGALLNLRHSNLILDGLSAEQIRLLCAELQSPQHMLPHLWRFPQWLAWGCYPLLALLTLATARGEAVAPEPARRRIVVLLGVLLVGLGGAWFGIETVGHLRLTLFQPFRMATVARGLCLVLVAGHVVRLWRRETAGDRLRAVLIAVGLAGDRMLVVVSLFEATMVAFDAARRRQMTVAPAVRIAGFGVLAAGVVFLSRHDTESGHVPVAAAAAATFALNPLVQRRSWAWSRRRAAFRLAAAWAVPVAALGANLIPDEGLTPRAKALRQTLVRRCRFAEVPVDDVERLAVWCRSHTPDGAVFIGPPGPKTFRLWSARNLAFNRAGSPYAAAGLADWAGRFADHVGVTGPPEDLVSAYLRDRHGLERRFDALSPDGLASLARRQGAEYVFARASAAPEGGADAPLTLLHAEGRYAVYRVEPAPRPDGRLAGAERVAPRE